MGENTPFESGYWLLTILDLILAPMCALLYVAFNRGGFLLTVLAILSASLAIVCSVLFLGTVLELMEVFVSVFRTRVTEIWRPR